MKNCCLDPLHLASYHDFLLQAKSFRKQKVGLAGNRTPDHSHAKGVLYH